MTNAKFLNALRLFRPRNEVESKGVDVVGRKIVERVLQPREIPLDIVPDQPVESALSRV